MAASRTRASSGTDPPLTARQDARAQLLLMCRLEDRSFALPASAVERILPMAALTPLPDAPRGVVGVLNLQGATLPVVDPRPRLDVSTPSSWPDQRLLVVSARTRYILWVDDVERIVSVLSHELDAIEVGTERALTPFIVRLDGAVLPVLSPEALDPGEIVTAAGGSNR